MSQVCYECRYCGRSYFAFSLTNCPFCGSSLTQLYQPTQYIIVRRPQRGFTLIELMIVVAIIGIIAAVVAPLITGKRSAYGARDFSNGEVVQRVDENSPRCVNGILLKNNEPVVVNGAAVKC